jgi:hypothetical protein
VTRLQGGLFGVRLSVGARDFSVSFFQMVQTTLGPTLALIKLVSVTCKASGAWIWQLPSTSTGLRMGGDVPPLSLYAFISCTETSSYLPLSNPIEYNLSSQTYCKASSLIICHILWHQKCHYLIYKRALPKNILSQKNSFFALKRHLFQIHSNISLHLRL